MPDPIRMAEAFIASMAIAFIASAVLGLAAARLLGRFSRNRLAMASAAIAMIAAVYTGAWILGLLPNFPPREDLDRLLLIVLPATVVAEVIAAVLGRFGWVARGIVAAIAAPVLLHGSVYITDLAGPGSRTWSPAETGLLFSVLATLLMATWIPMNRLAVHKGAGTALICVAGATLGGGLVIMLSGYATGGHLGIPLAAALVGIALGSLLSKRTLPEGALGVGVVGLFSLVVIGRLFADLTTLNAALLFAAPLLGWLPELLPAGTRVRVPLRLTLTAVPVVVALSLAKEKLAVDSVFPKSNTEASIADEYMNFGK